MPDPADAQHWTELEQLSLNPLPIEAGRREFVVTKIMAGFALAVQPVFSQVIKTSDEGLTAGEVKIPAKGGDMPAYRAQPAKGARFPTIVVVHEIFGVHEHIQDICRRLAKLGYLAIAPDLYARQGNVMGLSNTQDIFKIVSQVPDAQVLTDLDATVEWAGKNGGDAAKLGVTGFCWGGRIVWLYSAHQPKLKAGVAWYGRLVAAQPSELQPKYPVEIAADLKAPVLGLYGEADQGIPVASVEKMREAIKAAGKKSEIVLYPAGNHGFYADYRPSYQKANADDGWKRMLAWFQANGVA